ncbi:GNAT family N-acetyltransferase, partial [Desulfitobacterium sp.]|uniref:GNAT family N-acetyltransferase n=1 Tax=Desulfitobacterium sp. TaxID=49981 RepID=UPI002BC6A0EA
GGDFLNIIIKRANEEDSTELTSISFAAKRYWNYPDEYFEIWKNELTITPDYLNQNTVYVAQVDGKVIGFFSIVEVKENLWTGRFLMQRGFWLDHIFIQPEFIGKGIGSELISFAKEMCRRDNIDHLFLLSDPKAKGFYNKVGAQYIEEVPSNIEGRTVSLYRFAI